MSGTHEGGKKAAETNKERHGDDFYENIGQQGGSQNQSTQNRSAAASKDTGASKKDNEQE